MQKAAERGELRYKEKSAHARGELTWILIDDSVELWLTKPSQVGVEYVLVGEITQQAWQYRIELEILGVALEAELHRFLEH